MRADLGFGIKKSPHAARGCWARGVVQNDGVDHDRIRSSSEIRRLLPIHGIRSKRPRIRGLGYLECGDDEQAGGDKHGSILAHKVPADHRSVVGSTESEM